MGDWSDYFEDFSEENPVNQVNGHYHPNGAAINRAREQLAREQAALDAEIKSIIEKHRKPGLEKKGRTYLS